MPCCGQLGLYDAHHREDGRGWDGSCIHQGVDSDVGDPNGAPVFGGLHEPIGEHGGYGDGDDARPPHSAGGRRDLRADPLNPR